MIEINAIKQIGVFFLISSIIQFIWIILFGLNLFRFFNQRPFFGINLMILFPIIFLIISFFQIYVCANSYINVYRITGNFDIYASLDDFDYVTNKIVFNISYASLTLFGLVTLLIFHRKFPRK